MGGGTKTTNNTTQSGTQEIKLPAWVDAASQKNYAQAEQTAAGLQTYTGDTQADLGALTNQALTRIGSNAGATAPITTAAAGANGGLLGYQAPTVGAASYDAASLAGRDITPYLNPATQNLVDASLGDLEVSRQKGLLGNQATAMATSPFAWGGSRAGVVDAVTNAETNRAAGTIGAQLRSSAYDKAMSAMGADVGAENQARSANAGFAQQAGLANQAAANTAAGIRQGAVAGAGDLAKTITGINQTDVQGLLQGGAIQQTQAQAELNAQKGQFDAKQQTEIDRLNMLLSSLGMSPYGKTTNSTGTSNGTQTTSSSPDWATAGLGLLKIGAGFL